MVRVPGNLAGPFGDAIENGTRDDLDSPASTQQNVAVFDGARLGSSGQLSKAHLARAPAQVELQIIQRQMVTPDCLLTGLEITGSGAEIGLATSQDLIVVP